jgi:hypothetical protein
LDYILSQSKGVHKLKTCPLKIDFIVNPHLRYVSQMVYYIQSAR